MTVYFYQMCGRRARDNLTLSRGNVSSCVFADVTRPLAGFLPVVSADCVPRSFFFFLLSLSPCFVFFPSRRTSEVKNNRIARRVELRNTFSASFLFPCCARPDGRASRSQPASSPLTSKPTARPAREDFHRHADCASPINYLLGGRINTRGEVHVSSARLTD